MASGNKSIAEARSTKCKPKKTRQIMKRLILVMISILAAISTSAQEIKPQQSGGNRAKLPFEQQHEVRVSVGISPLFSMYNGLYDYLPSPYYVPRIIDGPTYTTGALSVSYGYRFRRWFDLGLLFSYNCEYKRQFNALSGDYLHRKYQHNITIMPTIRFTWLNRKWVRMYSSLGMGMTINTTNTTGSGGSTDGNSYALAFQCSYLGLTVGRSLFGFAELGFGAKGVAIFGMGYRFNNPKKQ